MDHVSIRLPRNNVFINMMIGLGLICIVILMLAGKAGAWNGTCYQDSHGTWWQKVTSETPNAQYIDGGWWIVSTPECKIPPITVVPTCPTPGQGQEQVTVKNPYMETGDFFVRSESYESEKITLALGEKHTFNIDVPPDYIGGGAELVVNLKKTKGPIVVPFNFKAIPPGCTVPPPAPMPATTPQPAQPAPPACPATTLEASISRAGHGQLTTGKSYYLNIAITNTGPNTAGEVLFSYNAPPGTKYVSGGEKFATIGKSWDLGPIAPSQTVNFRLKVRSARKGTVTHGIFATSFCGDTVSKTVSVNVTSPFNPTMVITKSMPDHIGSMQDFYSIVTVGNPNSTPIRVKVRDLLPKLLVGLKGQRVFGGIISLKPGGTHTFKFAMRPTAAALHQWIRNCATAQIVGFKKVYTACAWTKEPPGQLNLLPKFRVH